MTLTLMLYSDQINGYVAVMMLYYDQFNGYVALIYLGYINCMNYFG